MEQIIKKMEKGELHVHLNGLISTELIRTMLTNEDIEIPAGFNLAEDLSRTSPSLDLVTYLKPWQVLRLIPRSRKSLQLIVDNAFNNLKTENVSFVELRSSVIYIAFLNNIAIPTALSWLLRAIEVASIKYNIKAGLILTIPRGDYTADHLRALLNAYTEIGKPQLVVGLDLAGNEDAPIPSNIGFLFSEAKNEYGFKITIHAGETGNPENIKEAIFKFNADRIGHGTAAYKSQEIMNILREKNICLEICPISNRLTGAVGINESHPVSMFIENSVPFVICSDNPSIHNSSITKDYLEFYRETNNNDIIQNMLYTQKKYSFLKDLI